jgi:hypothetical protein
VKLLDGWALAGSGLEGQEGHGEVRGGARLTEHGDERFDQILIHIVLLMVSSKEYLAQGQQCVAS